MIANVFEKEIRIYRVPSGKVPYLVWFKALKDQRVKQKIQARIGRLRSGNFGQTRFIGSGVHEIKIDYGPGYRIYFGCELDTIVIILCGGNKSTQDEDIKTARQYWQAFQEEKNYADY